MSTQSYYKDRLGFDPREALADNNNGDVSPPLKSPHQRHSVSGGSASKHYYSNNGGGSPSPSGYNNGNVYSIQQALNHGLILPDTEAVPQDSGSNVPSKPSSIPLEFETRVTRTSNSKSVNITTEFLERERDTSTHELPANGWFLSDAIEKRLFDPVSGTFIVPGTDRIVSFEECIKFKIINPQSAFVADPKNRQRRVTLDRALEKKILDATGQYAQNKTKKIPMKEAIDRELIIFEHSSDEIPASTATRNLQITKIAGQPDLLEIRSGNDHPISVASTKVPELLSPEPLQLAPGIIYDPSTALVIFTDSGKSDSIVNAVASGKLDSNLVKITDPDTNAPITIAEALSRGILDPSSGEIKTNSGKSISLIEAARIGALVVCGAPLVAAAGAFELLKTMTDPKTGEQIPIELAYERGLITKSQLPSPERAALQKKLSVDSRRSSEGLVTITVSGDRAPFMLQRMRKCVLRPKDAAEKGIIDQETANALEDPKLFEGNNASLERVIAAGRLDGNRGKIVDPQRGHSLTINEAIRRGILDRHGTNNLFIPLAKSLAVPELKSQGLLNAADSKIYHPESGQLLSLREALICEIVDPLTEVTVEGKKQTLEQAIEGGVVDDDKNTINGVKLFDAIEGNVFVAPNYSPKIPPVGMTIPVIVKRNLLDTDRKQIIHPITKQPMDVNSAIKNDFVMAVPYTPNMDAVQINDALDRKLIITANESYKNPRTSEEVPLQEAIETGLLEVKPLPELVQGMQANTAVMSVTESVSSYHTITTKTVEIQSGFAMISATEVQDTNTGAIMSVDEARQKGILSDAVDSERQVLTEEVNINFTDALQRGLLNVSKGTFTHPTSGDVMSISDAVDRGFIATRNASDEALNRSPEMTHKVISTVQITGPKSSSVERTIPISQVGSSSDPKGESKLGENIKDAAKLGLMAVVGAPVLGGMAIASGVKKLFEKKESEQSETVVTHSGGSVVESTSKYVSSSTVQVMTKTVEEISPAGVQVSSSATIPTESSNSATIQIVTKTIEVEVQPEELTKTSQNEPQEPIATKPVEHTKEPVTSQTVIESTDLPTEPKEKVGILPTEPKKESEGVKSSEPPTVLPTESKDESEDGKPKDLSVEPKEDAEVIQSIDEFNVDSQTQPTNKGIDVSSKLVKEASEEPAKPSDGKQKVEEDPTTKALPSYQESVEIIKTVSVESTQVISVETSSTVSESKFEDIQAISEQDQPQIETSIDNTSDKPTIPAVASEKKLPVTDSKKDIDEDPSNLKKSVSQKSGDNSVTDSAQDTDKGNDTGKKILDAAKLGLMAVVGAPILAGKAVVDALKKDGSSTQEPVDDSKLSVTESRTVLEESKPVIEESSPLKSLKQENDSVAPKDKPDQVVTASEPTVIDEKVVEKQQVVKQEPTSGSPEVAQVVDNKAELEVPEVADVVDNEPILSNDHKIADPNQKDLVEKTHEVTETRPDQAQKVEDDTTETHDRHVVPISDSVTSDTVEQSIQPKDNELVKSDDQHSTAQDHENNATLKVAEPQPDLVQKDLNSETQQKKVDPVSDPATSNNVEQPTQPKNKEPAKSDNQHSTVQEKATPDQVQKVEDLTLSSDLQKQAITPTEAQKAQDYHFDQVAVPATSGTAERPTQLEPISKESSSNETGKKILDAAKLGLMAVVGAPILAGKAVVDALKKDHSGEDAPQQVVASPGDGRREFKELEQTIGDILDREDDGKLRTPEKHVTFDIEESQGPTDVQYERMPLGEAISQGKILPKQCKVLVDDKEMPYTVDEGLNNRNVRIYDIVDVLSQELVSFVEGETDALVIDETLTKQKLIDLGLFDPESGSFTSPSGERISFRDLLCSTGMIDPSTVFVKDLGRDKYEPLDVALQKHLIDKHTGHMLDNKTGKKVKFVECCKRAWIIQREPSSENLDQSPTLTEVLDAGQFNPQTGEVLQNQVSVPIAEALRAGFIDNDSVSVRDPTDGEIVPLQVAIERGVIDLKLGVIYNRETQEEIDLNEAYNRGYMLAGKRKPISLEAAVRKGLYNPESGLILDTITEEMVDVQQSVDKGIVDPKISNIKDTRENVLVPLQAAIDQKLIDTESGKLKDTSTDELVSLDVALEKKMMDTKQVTHSLIDVLNKEFYNPKSGKILNPGNGEESILKDAVQARLIEIDSVLIRDERKNEVMKCADAIEKGLVDDVRGVLTRPELTLDRAYQKGYILSNKKPISLADALVRGFYDQSSGLLHIEGAPGVTLEQAIANQDISTSDLIVRDPKNRGVASLADAIKEGLVDPVSGTVVDSGSGLSMGMLDALERGIIVVAKRRCSLPDAVFRGLYDPKSGQFSSTTTPEKMSTERAIRRGMLDPESTIVNVAGKILPFELAVENGTVDVKRGTLVDEVGNKIDFREAFDRGLLVEVRKPISLSEAVLKGIYRESSGLFMDPKNGKKLTLAQAIAEKMIDPHSVQIKDPVTGYYKNLDLVDAIETDLINGQNSNVKHGNDKITLKHAFDIGLLYDKNAPISLQRVIHQGIYEDKSGKIVDPSSGRKITLHEATRKFVINPQLPCYFNERDEVMLNLFELFFVHRIN